MRASMGQDRLGSLALIHIHHDADINLDTVVDMFAKKHPRRMQLKCMIAD
jgi:hypothetical protein